MKRTVRRGIFYVLLFFFLMCFSGSAGAEEYVFRSEEAGSGAVGDAWDRFLSALPDAESWNMAEADLSDPLAAAETVRSTLDPGKIAAWFRGVLIRGAERVIPAAAPLFGLILLAAAIRLAVPPGSSSGAMNEAFLRVARLAAAVTVYRLTAEILAAAERAVGTVCRLAELLIPVTEGICLMGGGLTEGQVSRVGLMLAVTAAEEAAGRILIPASGAVLGLSAVSGGRGPVGAMAGGIRKTLLRVWQMLTVGMTFLLGAQTVLAHSADSMGLRWSRFALSSFVPVAGSALSDAWATVSSGIRALRGAAGIGGILALGAAALPSALPLLLWQAVFGAANGAAEALEVKELAPLFREAGGIAGLLAAFTLYTLAMFTVELALFAGIGAGG
ncbi:MAG: hypothetical protein E7576_17320 [Ruminococcaceae bacterium]|nr:hypothetical protein [Oscillospiraceae bacterium]